MHMCQLEGSLFQLLPFFPLFFKLLFLVFCLLLISSVLVCFKLFSLKHVG